MRVRLSIGKQRLDGVSFLELDDIIMSTPQYDDGIVGTGVNQSGDETIANLEDIYNQDQLSIMSSFLPSSLNTHPGQNDELEHNLSLGTPRSFPVQYHDPIEFNLDDYFDYPTYLASENYDVPVKLENDPYITSVFEGNDDSSKLFKEPTTTTTTTTTTSTFDSKEWALLMGLPSNEFTSELDEYIKTNIADYWTEDLTRECNIQTFTGWQEDSSDNAVFAQLQSFPGEEEPTPVVTDERVKSITTPVVTKKRVKSINTPAEDNSVKIIYKGPSYSLLSDSKSKWPVVVHKNERLPTLVISVDRMSPQQLAERLRFKDSSSQKGKRRQGRKRSISQENPKYNGQKKSKQVVSESVENPYRNITMRSATSGRALVEYKTPNVGQGRGRKINWGPVKQVLELVTPVSKEKRGRPRKMSLDLPPPPTTPAGKEVLKTPQSYNLRKTRTPK